MDEVFTHTYNEVKKQCVPPPSLAGVGVVSSVVHIFSAQHTLFSPSPDFLPVPYAEPAHRPLRLLPKQAGLSLPRAIIVLILLWLQLGNYPDGAASPLFKINYTDEKTTAAHNIWQVKEKKMQPVLLLLHI